MKRMTAAIVLVSLAMAQTTQLPVEQVRGVIPGPGPGVAQVVVGVQRGVTTIQMNFSMVAPPTVPGICRTSVEMAIDEGGEYLYVCAMDRAFGGFRWKRVALAEWK